MGPITNHLPRLIASQCALARRAGQNLRFRPSAVWFRADPLEINQLATGALHFCWAIATHPSCCQRFVVLCGRLLGAAVMPPEQWDKLELLPTQPALAAAPARAAEFQKSQGQ